MRDDVSVAQVCAKLGPLESAEDERRLMVFPFGIGQTVYGIRNKKVIEFMVCSIDVCELGVYIFNSYKKRGAGFNPKVKLNFYVQDIGRLAFHTQAAAEVALAAKEANPS